MTLTELAHKLRPIIEQAMQSVDDATALDAVNLFPKWEVGQSYAPGIKVRYNDILYSVLTAHTSQSDWTPDVAPSLFVKVLIPDPNVVPEWEQPDSTNPYKKGDKVSYNGKIYISLIDGNVWSPEAYPAGWEMVI
jgi:hypothetical protein